MWSRRKREVKPDILTDDRVVLQYETGKNKPVLIHSSKEEKETISTLRKFQIMTAVIMIRKMRGRKWQQRLPVKS